MMNPIASMKIVFKIKTSNFPKFVLRKGDGAIKSTCRTIESHNVDDGSTQIHSSETSKLSFNKHLLNSSTPSFSFKHDANGKLRLGNYEVQRTIGVGRQARVLLARNVFTDKNVALKVIDSEDSNSKVSRSISGEIEALQSISHPHILTLREVYHEVTPTPKILQSSSATVMVLDYCSGGELFDIMLVTGGFSEELARTYFIQILSAVHACHSNGVYHRDIKPQNILLDSSFNLKLADFGVCSRKLEGPDICDTFCGTLSYMAPEVISGHSYSAGKADSWSLGIVLFILLSGSPPLKVAASSDWWFKAIQTGRMEKFWHAHERVSPSLPSSARGILNRLLVANPSERSSVKDILNDPWLFGQTLSSNEVKREMSRRLKVTKASLKGMKSSDHQDHRANHAARETCRAYS